MRAVDLLLILSIVLAILGAGCTYTGYNASSQIVTVTTTQSTTVVATESSVVWTTTSRSLHRVIRIMGPSYCGEFGPCCGIYDDSARMSLNPGKLHISYTSSIEPPRKARPVIGPDLVLFDSIQHDQWVGQARSCFEFMQTPAIASVFNQPSHELTVDISSSDTYYFTFSNRMDISNVTVTLDVWQEPQQAQVAVTTTKLVPTQVVNVVSRPAGLGLLFFLGVVLLVAGIGLGVTSSHRPSLIAEAAAAKRPPPTTTKFCRKCGAQIPRDSMYCQECGAALG